MERIQDDEFIKLQEECQKSDLSRWIKEEMEYFCKLIEKRAEKNNCSISQVVLNYPNDCNNYNIFLRFAKMFKCSFAVINERAGQYKIYNIGEGYHYIIIDKQKSKSNEEADRRYEKKGRRK